MKEQRKNSYIQTDARPRRMLKNSRAPAEKPAAIIDFRAVHNLGTKVLADKLTIDEILRVCSNPKVEPLGT